jgi:hypothetical protein
MYKNHAPYGAEDRLLLCINIMRLRRSRQNYCVKCLKWVSFLFFVAFSVLGRFETAHWRDTRQPYNSFLDKRLEIIPPFYIPVF